MKEIIEAIQKNLAENSNILYVDENWGQLDYYSPNFPVKWPCVLIDIVSAGFSDIGKDQRKNPINRQIGSITVELRIANLRLSNTSAKAPSIQKQNTRSIWNLIEEIHTQLHGCISADNISKLKRVSVNRVKRDDGIQEYAVRYTCELQDC